MVVINNSRPEVIERRYSSVDEEGSGWTVAVLVLLALIVLGLMFWWRGQGAAPAPSTNVNVSAPAGETTPVYGTNPSAAGTGDSAQTDTSANGSVTPTAQPGVSAPSAQ